jgi:putative PEP-CTERM system TPR-repeat lipoprotein
MMLLGRKRTDDAIREAKTAISQDERNAMAHNVLGSAYLAKGNYAEGMTELNKALELDPSLADVHVKKGIAALRRGKGEEAEAELAAAVRLKPDAQEARRTLALYYINRNEPAKAIDVLKKGMQGGPSDAVSYYLMGEAYARQNNLNEARAQYQKAKEVDPKYDLAYFRIASLDFMQQKQEDGIREIRSLLEKEPGNVQALLQLASIAEVRSDEGEARRNYLAAAETDTPEGVIAAALYLQRTNDTGKAISLLDDAIKKHPKDLRLLEVKGRLLLANNKYKDALSTFEAIDRMNHKVGFGYLVNTYAAMGEYPKALELVQSEIRNDPTNLGLRAELSRIYLQKGDKAAAIENARDIIKKNPESPVGHAALALIYESSNEIDKAIEVLKSAPRKNDATLTFLLGNLSARKKNYPAALEHYRQVEKMKAGSDEVLYQKGNVLYAMGRKKEAIEEYQKVLRLSPNHALALNNLAYLHAEENKDKPLALVYASRAFMLAPQNDNVRDTLGYVLLKNGKVDQGLVMLKKASEGSPKNPSIQYHLALAYKERGDSARAVEHLQKALAMGDFPEAGEAKALLEKMKK